MFAGAYWPSRAETREQAACRIVAFLKALRPLNGSFAIWYLTAHSKRAALVHVLQVDIDGVVDQLHVHRKDVGGDVIPKLGYSLAVWNGDDMGLSVSIGSHSRYVGNSVVLSGQGRLDCAISDAVWREILSAEIREFEPEHAVVGCEERVIAAAPGKLAEIGWLTYDSRHGVEEHPERR
jgi:immunity protein 52 of polymorphic toxin system